MNLVLIAALIAVCGAAKLDRTYLPPVSAKTAGGSPGSLQVPFAGNSFAQSNNGLPKGSFTNEFEGVVVDASTAGTRASGEGDTGLGAPRPTYGSSNSKVGAAAFRGQAGFRGQADFRGQAGFEQIPGQQSVDETQTSDSDVQAASPQEAAQGFDQANAASRFESKPERAQAAYDRVANTLRFENEIGPDGYHYAFETDNGILAEENGVATNGVQAQGGYSYTGDDGQVYTITYTADEGGYQPKGDHLPTPPPIPEEILKALEQNAKDESEGVIDDGSYDAQRYNAEGDYAESDNVNLGHNDRQAPKFGKRPESDATASGTFIDQSSQAFVQPNANGLPEREDGSSGDVNKSNNAFGPSNSVNGLDQGSQPTNRFGSRNEYLPPVNGFNQNGRPQRPISTPEFNSPISDSDLNANTPALVNSPVIGNQPPRPNSVFGRPSSNRLDVLAQSANNKPLASNEFEPTSNVANVLRPQQSGRPINSFESRNEYLPPVRGFVQNGRPQKTISDATPAQSFNQFSQASSDFPPFASSNPSTEIESTAPTSQELNSFQQRPQPSQNLFSQNVNRFPQENRNGQNGKASVSYNTQRPTSQPSIELTTPLETNEPSSNESGKNLSPDRPTLPTFSAFSSVKQSRPESNFENKPSNEQFLSRPNSSSTNNQNTRSQNSAFASQGSNQYQPFSTGNQQQSTQNELSQNQPGDTQYSPSTVRPTFNRQPQGPDDSYYYRQPARPFNTPFSASNSRFPSAPSGQFNVSPQQNVPINQFQTAQQPNRGSTKYPEPPTVAPLSPTESVDGQYQGSTIPSQYNGITQANISPFQAQGSTKYPRPPTVAPTLPSKPAQGFPTQNNGLTQATATAFTAAPTPVTNFNKPSFGPRPTFTSPQYSQQKQVQSQPSKQFAQQPASRFPSQSQTGQAPSANEDITDNGPAVSSQQYNGEIYEYTKPPQGLPAPSNTDLTSGQQRVQQSTQFSSSQSSSDVSNPQQPMQSSFGARPQLGSQSLRPQFNGQFNKQSLSSQDQPAEDSKQQFNVQPKPQPLGQQPLTDTRPQFNSYKNGRPNKCCQSLDAQIAQLESTHKQSNRGQSGQFGTQFSGPNSQSASQSFAGRGEIFGGPRKPPSFDQETGYHY